MMRESNNISGAWYFAFFLVGILLGLVVLHFYDVGGYLLAMGDSTAESINEVDIPNDKQKQAAAHGKTVPTEKKPNEKPGGGEEQSGAVAEPDAVSNAEPSVIKTEPVLCDLKKAQAVRDKARKIAEIVTYSDHLSVNLSDKWAYYSDSVRHSFVEKFSESDTCLSGHSRPIQFFYQGKLFASTEPEKGIIYE